MVQAIRRFFSPPGTDDYQLAQRLRLLHAMLVWTFVAAATAAVVSIGLKDTESASIMAALAVGCLVGIGLNHAGHSNTAAMILCFGVFITVTVQVYSNGGILSSGIIVYPVLVLEATFLFGNRLGRLITTAATIIVVVGLWEAEQAHLITGATKADFGRVVAIAVVLLATAGITQVVRSTWDDNLARLIDSYDKTLLGWARALEYHDNETAGHCARVATMATELAQKLGCSRDEVEAIRRGAYLHDIGKMGIPEEILNKPGPLTAEERTVIQRHPQMGADLVGDIPFLEPATLVVQAHHECWDGTGYPLGLKGEQIPIGARVFAVIDHWDALTSDRPYRPAWSRAETVAHIRENAGVIFDPRVAEAFLEMVAEPENEALVGAPEAERVPAGVASA